MLVRISHPTCCPPTLMPTPSTHPLRAPTVTLSMPPPPARRPLRPAALSVPPPPPSPSSHRRWAGVRSYGAVPARSASLCVMAAVPGGGGSRTMTAGTNSGCAACNPYPALSCALRHRVPPCHRHPLHAAATLYTLPPPSTCRPTLYTPPPPSTHCHHPLHTAAALYTPPPPPSPCHPHCPYVPSLVSPLAAASTCGAARVRGLHACAMRSPGPSGHTLPSHVSRPRPHLSHGPTRHPSAPLMSRPRPSPSPPGPHPRPCNAIT